MLAIHEYKLCQDRPVAVDESDLARKHTPLVKWAAKKLYWQGRTLLEMDDLIGWGNIGLVQAIREFDPSTGNAFSTYALPLIFQMMQQGIMYEYRCRGRREGWTRTGKLVSSTLLLASDDFDPLDKVALKTISTSRELDSRHRLRDKLQDLVAVAKTPREKSIVRFLLKEEGERGWKTECAKKVHLSRERVRQIYCGLMDSVRRKEDLDDLARLRQRIA